MNMISYLTLNCDDRLFMLGGLGRNNEKVVKVHFEIIRAGRI